MSHLTLCWILLSIGFSSLSFYFFCSFLVLILFWIVIDFSCKISWQTMRSHELEQLFATELISLVTISISYLVFKLGSYSNVVVLSSCVVFKSSKGVGWDFGDISSYCFLDNEGFRSNITLYSICFIFQAQVTLLSYMSGIGAQLIV